MRKSPFDFNRDGKLDSFEQTAVFAFLNDLLNCEEPDEEEEKALPILISEA